MERQTIENEALTLGAEERVSLADALLSSLDAEATKAIEEAWAEEAESRLAGYRSGKVTALDGGVVIAELRGRYKR